MTNKELQDMFEDLICECIKNDIYHIDEIIRSGKCRIHVHFDYTCLCKVEECNEKKKP